MARYSGTTTQRGLGWQHQKARTAALAALKDGDLCARCEARGIEHQLYRSMVIWKDGKPTSPWLDLDDFPGRRVGGPQVKRLSGRKCNRRSGAHVTNQIRRGRSARRYTRW